LFATLANERLNGYFAAAYEAACEAVYNCLIAARPARRLDGSMQDRFPVDAVRGLSKAPA
jgi:L-aminopeptidase/D-esterase-like protein